MVSFYAFPAIFINTVAANRFERPPSHLSCKKSIVLLYVNSFQKEHPYQKGECPDTLDTPAPLIHPWKTKN